MPLKGSFYDGFKWSENVIFLGDKNIESVEIPELNTRGVWTKLSPD